jgi:tetratricopeptide (TPR) repeat protein
LRRLDGDAAGAAADLAESLRLAPWDDSSWAELADDLAAAREPDQALQAIRRAMELDPGYGDYRQVEVSLLLRLGRLEPAEDALRKWRKMDRRPRFRSIVDYPVTTGDGEDGDADADPGAAAFAEGGEDPRIAVFQAALELARGRRELAVESLDALMDADDPALDLAAADPALAGLRGLLPGGGGRA